MKNATALCDDIEGDIADINKAIDPPAQNRAKNKPVRVNLYRERLDYESNIRIENNCSTRKGHANYRTVSRQASHKENEPEKENPNDPTQPKPE